MRARLAKKIVKASPLYQELGLKERSRYRITLPNFATQMDIVLSV